MIQVVLEARSAGTHLVFCAGTAPNQPQMRSNVNSAAWQIGTSATMLEVAQKERPSAKALFSVVSQQTGLETPEEFSDKYLRIEAMVRAPRP